jgi:hypothetical protein
LASFDWPYADRRDGRRGPSSEIRSRARAWNRLDAVHEPVDQQAGQREVAEVVDAEVTFKAVGGDVPAKREQPGVVDQQRHRLVDSSREGPHRCKRSEVEPAYLDVSRHRRCRALAFGHVAASEDHPTAGPSQLSGRHQPEPAVRSGDDRRTSRQVRNVSGHPPGHPALASRGRRGLVELDRRR